MAMGLFIDQGYEKTSLREIADELGVTKAALYYHFRTKRDIVEAAFQESAEQVEEIRQWLSEAPPSRRRNKELVERLATLIGGDAGLAMRFGQANPTTMTSENLGQQQSDQVAALITQLAGEQPTAEQSIKAMLAFGALALSGAGTGARVAAGTAAERRAAGSAVALELLDSIIDQ